MQQGKPDGSDIWSRNTAAGRWYAFGRYYAMFPRAFIHDAVDGLTDENDVVLDPFCGRGNAPFRRNGPAKASPGDRQQSHRLAVRCCETTSSCRG